MDYGGMEEALLRRQGLVWYEYDFDCFPRFCSLLPHRFIAAVLIY